MTHNNRSGKRIQQTLSNIGFWYLHQGRLCADAFRCS